MEERDNKIEKWDNNSESGITIGRFGITHKWLIISIIIALLCCGITLYIATGYQKSCNDHWLAELERLHCTQVINDNFPRLFNTTLQQHINGG